MTVTERSRRSRAKAKARMIQTSQADLLAGSPEAIAERIFARVSLDTARGIAMALQQRLMQGFAWPLWRPPMM